MNTHRGDPEVAKAPETVQGLQVEQDLDWVSRMVGSEERAEELWPELDRLAEIGSPRLNSSTHPDKREQVVGARMRFYLALGITQETLDKRGHYQRKRPTTVTHVPPPATFISAQRVLAPYGADVITMYQQGPALLPLSGRRWVERLESSPPAEVIRTLPEPYKTAAVSDVRLGQGFAHMLRLGMDVQRILKRKPLRHSLLIPAIDQKIAALTGEGLDAISVLNRSSSAFQRHADVSKSKIRHIREMGLDARRIVMNYPPILSGSMVTKERRFRMLRLGGALLRWQGSVTELVNAAPSVLNTNDLKLLILMHLAASGASEERRREPVSRVRSFLIKPLEAYIIGYGQLLDQLDSSEDVISLGIKASHTFTEADERKRIAIDTVQSRRHSMGRIAELYLEYAGIPANT